MKRNEFFCFPNEANVYMNENLNENKKFVTYCLGRQKIFRIADLLEPLIKLRQQNFEILWKVL